MKAISLTSKTDVVLIQDFITNNNNQAFEELYNKYFKRVYNKCLSFTRNPEDAFDYTQDIMIKALSSLRTFKGDSKFSTWLYAITRNYCITDMAKKNRVLSQSIVDLLVYSAVEEIDISEISEKDNLEYMEGKLEEILVDIPESDRDMLLMKYKNNCSIKELQEHYGISSSAVKMRLMRTRQKIEGIYNSIQIAV